ncbi:Ap3d1 protein [Auriscalpium vulgare]|uniref:Ap3d1 protein n=1 Tax=Auriscalpium vulgare TaxID=40419 RepID=A0ACB8S3F6_9AGAM|nr:Ap3d1 protein [Auriscalpium vulgare]
MWERTLQDLIRGLRANKKDEAKFIAQAVDEIRKEIRSKDMELKAGAILKLTYLDMLGYDMSWASFNVVEVMSSPKYHLKSVGYLAASQSFGPDTDVLMLTTNLLKKDLVSNPGDIAISLNGLSHFVSPDLARDLSHDLVAMLNHSRPHIRKRAVIAVYKALVKYPDATAFALTRMKEKLDDPDQGVVSATINVLCELVRRNPQDYLPLAPQLFRLLTTSSNNWMLIKLIKLFGFLSPYEPRLVRKLQPPITELISTTPAISLLYECVHTCIVGGMLQMHSGNSLAEMCVTKLAAFLQDPDQNLKYIALLALVKIVPSHPHLVAKYQDVIMTSVNDQDISIRMRALDLITAMVTPDNLQSIAQQLLSHLVRPDPSTALPSATQSLANVTSPSSVISPLSPSQSSAYRLTLSQRIVEICSQDTYANVADFQWYLSVLVDLSYVANVDIGKEIRDQLVDVVSRVRAVRRWAVELMIRLLSDDTFLRNAREEGSCAEVLWAAAWIVGENSSEISEPHKLLQYLLQPQISTLAPETIAVYLQASVKLFGVWAAGLSKQWDNDDLPKVKDIVETIIGCMREFAASADIEVQERAANALQLFSFVRADINSFRPRTDSIIAIDGGFETSMEDPIYPKSLLLVNPLFSLYELNPVNLAAQNNVPVPEGLDLDAWIVPPPRDTFLEPASVAVDDDLLLKKGKSKGKGKAKAKEGKAAKNSSRRGGERVVLTSSETPETPEQRAEREQQRLARLERQREDPYYIGDKTPSRPDQDDIDSIPVVHLDDMPPLPAANSAASPHFSSLLRESTTHISAEPVVVDRDGEMPEGAVLLPPLPPSQKPSRPITPLSNGASAHAPPAFPEYVIEDEVPRTGTPEPIKVVRAKKKSTPGAKKKRTRPAELEGLQ